MNSTTYRNSPWFDAVSIDRSFEFKNQTWSKARPGAASRESFLSPKKERKKERKKEKKEEKERNCRGNETFFKRRRGHRDMRQIPTVRDVEVVVPRGGAQFASPKKIPLKMMFLELF